MYILWVRKGITSLEIPFVRDGALSWGVIDSLNMLRILRITNLLKKKLHKSPETTDIPC